LILSFFAIQFGNQLTTTVIFPILSSQSNNILQPLLMQVFPLLQALPTMALSFFFTRSELSYLLQGLTKKTNNELADKEEISKTTNSTWISNLLSAVLVSLAFSNLSVGGDLWSVHNIVNVFITITMSRLLQLKQLSYIILALVGLCVYDVISVYGTQSFTDGGQSIMEAVARAKISSTPPSDSGTTDTVITSTINSFIPMIKSWSPGLFEVNLNHRITDILGIADVLFPSLLLTWAKRNDFTTIMKKDQNLTSYTTSCSVGFLIGCFMCEVFQTGQGQPALLFLVPSMFISLTFSYLVNSIITATKKVDVE
jgi:presenilin-like A22 family membrane protease/uncharacterized membrane protein YciS (DUF1049 family)